mmetsp:Transcript_5811/g.8641  ORF Transcript_5811/g.8641 Transcript_5811/m.8641 type:complete len:541 (+) Transcript_5811:66-1688(+)|eukprot:CAMPEP_0197242802 /NCGR_PEP_ID=MMETSP1429-20130617/8437_1 /TAXON_ID=49237 /ORGANISM="Chaetoceros  sp., Strain UNC1202" /LENGTH=540 /DNA_ID=CAMNT_0042702897 /DNA_START=66 /DNA_END=1688 /DNA_ORIENTATION=-
MSETIETVETTPVAAAPAADVPAPATSGESTQPQGEQKPRRQRTPPEELFDLTQPIPRVEKPNKATHDEDIEAINTAIDALKETKNAVQQKIDMALNGGRNSAAGKEREALRSLRNTKGSLINEKKIMVSRLSQIKKVTDGLMNDRKATRANVRFGKVEDIDAEIKKLKTRQETVSMSLTEEKKLLKEIDVLQASKQLLSGLEDTNASIDSAKAQRGSISDDIKAKDTEIDAVQEEITAKQTILDDMKKTESEFKKQLDSLTGERNDVRKQIGEKIGERNKARDAFREANDKWYDYQRGVKAQKKMKYDEEKKKREGDKAAFLAAKEAEEAKKIPYEEEMNLCDYLADYLSKTYLSGDKKKDSGSKKSDVIAVKDDPFAGLVPMKKKDDGIFMKMGPGKKPRVKSTKKKSAPIFKLNVDSFEQFGFLNLTPPTKFDAVQNSVDELRAKKQWYSEQPRGSVPTATEIRKANEKAAAKLTQGETSSAPKKNGKLDISSDDFAPLSVGASSSAMNAAWGQKSAEEEVVAEEPSAEEAEETVEA